MSHFSRLLFYTRLQTDISIQFRVLPPSLILIILLALMLSFYIYCRWNIIHKSFECRVCLVSRITPWKFVPSRHIYISYWFISCNKTKTVHDLLCKMMSRKQANIFKKSKESVIFYNALFVSIKVNRVEPESTNNKNYDGYRQQWTEFVHKCFVRQTHTKMYNRAL